MSYLFPKRKIWQRSDAIELLSPEDRQRFDEEYKKRKLDMRRALFELAFSGCVGGHRAYLDDPSGAALYGNTIMTIALGTIMTTLSIYFHNHLGPMAIWILIPGIMLWGASLMVFWAMFTLEAIFVPVQVGSRNAQTRHEIASRIQIEKQRPDWHIQLEAEASADQNHARFHRDLKKQTVTVHEAYKRLLTFGIFGAHKEYLGDARAATVYRRLIAGCGWALVLWLPFIVWMGTAVLVAGFALAAVLIVWAPTGAALLLYRLAGDAFTLPQQVAARQVAIQQRLLGATIDPQ
jgi:hypothetical protein